MRFNLRQKIFSWIRLFFIALKAGDFKFGSNVYIGPGCRISPIYKLEIGSDIYIGKNVTIEVEGVIGSGVIIANNVGIVGRRDHDVFSSKLGAFYVDTVRDNRLLSLPIDIGNGVWIGYGAIILSGISVGDNSVISAGAVVIKDFPVGAIVAGSPARVIGFR